MKLIFPVLALAVGAAAILYCLPRLYRSTDSVSKPIYFQMYFWAQCCYVISTLSDVVIFVCNGYENSIVTVGLIGHFGVYWALLNANRSQLDSIVDDRTNPQAGIARLSAIAAPVLFSFSLYLIFMRWYRPQIFHGAALVISMLPVIPASYYNLKHLLLPMDDLHLLKGSRLCNIFSLVFYTARVIYYLAMPYISREISGLLFLFCAIMMACISFSTVKGARQWSPY